MNVLTAAAVATTALAVLAPAIAAPPRIVHVRTLTGAPVWDVAYDPKGRFFAYTRGKGDYGSDPENTYPRPVIIAAPTTGATRRTLTGMTSHIWDIALSPDGARLAACAQDGTLRTWAVSSGRPLAVGRLAGTALKSLAWSPDGRTIATGDFGYGVSLWDAATLRRLHHATLSHGERMNLGLNQVAFSRNGRWLVGLADDDAFVTWRLPGLRKVREFPSYPTAQFATDGRALIHLSERPWRPGAQLSLAVWDLQTGRTRLMAPAVTPHALWRGRGHVVGQTPDDRLAVLRLADGRILASGPRVPPQDGLMTACAVSPDGRWIVAGSVYADGLWMYEVR